MAVVVEMEPVQRSQLTEQVIERIKSYIESNNLQAGARLPGERELAATLGVSRNVTREAIRVLQATGLLDIQPGNGIFVSTLDFGGLAKHIGFAMKRQPDLMGHLVEARVLFESGILDLVGKKVTEAQLARLEEANPPRDETTTRQQAVDNDIEFHRRLVEMAQNPILLEFTSLISRFFQEAVTNAHRIEPGPVKDHCEIIEALRRGDVAAAKASLERGIRSWTLE